MLSIQLRWFISIDRASNWQANSRSNSLCVISLGSARLSLVWFGLVRLGQTAISCTGRFCVTFKPIVACSHLFCIRGLLSHDQQMDASNFRLCSQNKTMTISKQSDFFTVRFVSSLEFGSEAQSQRFPNLCLANVAERRAKNNDKTQISNASIK